MWMEQVTQPGFCHGKHFALFLFDDTKSAFATVGHWVREAYAHLAKALLAQY